MYGGVPYAGGPYAGTLLDEGDIPVDTDTHLAVEVAFTTDALAEPAWVDITGDVRWWDTLRGRNRELERFQPGRATVVLTNRDRQYDSVNAAGPWYGNLKPMRRLRIRETFSGVTYPVYDGFIDRWQLDYPDTGKDATATVTATDLFKVFARTDLPISVYRHTVEADSPVIWWRLNEGLEGLQDGAALNAGTFGTTHNATFVGNPQVGAQGLIVHDPGPSMATVDSSVRAGTPVQGVELEAGTFDLMALDAWSVEMWVREDDNGTTQGTAWCYTAAADTTFNRAIAGRSTSGSFTDQFIFAVFNAAGTQYYGRQTAAGFVVPHSIHHLVCTKASDGLLSLWVDGVEQTAAITGGGGTTHPGPLPSGKPLTIGFSRRTNNTESALNWTGEIDEVAIYDSVLPADRIAAHYTAGTAPWQGDLPAVRAGRVLDLVGLAAADRELDDGAATLQSAELGTTALEHLQKIGETEFGLLFVTRDGKVRLVDRAALAARTTAPDPFGDVPGEVGYREITPDDGDAVIRNRATISRYNGVAETVEDTASVDEYGRFDYLLDGLLHDSDAYSATYAADIVDEYAAPRRRITRIAVGPAIPGEEPAVVPAMLSHELGAVVTVRHRPLGGGDPFAQACVVEGIGHTGRPGGERTARLTLSPAPAAITPVPLGEALLLETGDQLLTESGDTLVLEGPS